MPCRALPREGRRQLPQTLGLAGATDLNSLDTVSVETLAAFAAAWNRHDIEALMSFMTEDCEFHAVAGPDLLGRSFVGREAVRQGFQLAWQTCPDAQWLDGVHVVASERGFSESTFCGTRAADGLRIEARMVDVFTFRGGRIAVKNAFRKDRPARAPQSR
jgi:ketosteroid isomerase-like protein